MVRTGADVPAPLVRAFWDVLESDDRPPLARRPFLRTIAERAAGPRPRDRPADSSRTSRGGVPIEDGVTLAVAVVAQFDPGADHVATGDEPRDPGLASGAASEPDGREARRELVRRVRRRVTTRMGRR